MAAAVGSNQMVSERKVDWGELDPRETRILALAMEGRSVEDVGRMLGIGTVALRLMADRIREKLQVPEGEDLSGYLAIGEPAHEPETVDKEGRFRLSLRMTIDELGSLLASAELRAKILEQSVAMIGGEDQKGLSTEVEDLRYIADELANLRNSVIKRVRRS